jgi:hypothetical protein
MKVEIFIYLLILFENTFSMKDPFKTHSYVLFILLIINSLSAQISPYSEILLNEREDRLPHGIPLHLKIPFTSKPNITEIEVFAKDKYGEISDFMNFRINERDFYIDDNILHIIMPPLRSNARFEIYPKISISNQQLSQLLRVNKHLLLEDTVSAQRQYSIFYDSTKFKNNYSFAYRNLTDNYLGYFENQIKPIYEKLNVSHFKSTTILSEIDWNAIYFINNHFNKDFVLNFNINSLLTEFQFNELLCGLRSVENDKVVNKYDIDLRELNLQITTNFFKKLIPNIQKYIVINGHSFWYTSYSDLSKLLTQLNNIIQACEYNLNTINSINDTISSLINKNPHLKNAYSFELNTMSFDLRTKGNSIFYLNSGLTLSGLNKSPYNKKQIYYLPQFTLGVSIHSPGYNYFSKSYNIRKYALNEYETDKIRFKDPFRTNNLSKKILKNNLQTKVTTNTDTCFVLNTKVMPITFYITDSTINYYDISNKPFSFLDGDSYEFGKPYYQISFSRTKDSIIFTCGEIIKSYKCLPTLDTIHFDIYTLADTIKFPCRDTFGYKKCDNCTLKLNKNDKDCDNGKFLIMQPNFFRNFSLNISYSLTPYNETLYKSVLSKGMLNIGIGVKINTFINLNGGFSFYKLKNPNPLFDNFIPRIGPFLGISVNADLLHSIDSILGGIK